MHRQLGEQVLQRRLGATNPDRILANQGRSNNTLHDQLWHRVNGPDIEHGLAARFLAAHYARQFSTDGEDVFCVIEDHAPHLGQHETSTRLVEQSLTDSFVQQLQLAADGLRRYVQDVRRLGDAAFAGDGPEVMQVAVIEVAHPCPPLRLDRSGSRLGQGRLIVRLIRINHSNRSTLPDCGHPYHLCPK